VAVADRDTFLVALLERGSGLFAHRLGGVEVVFHAGGEELGRARTDKDGYAVAIGRLPAGARKLEARATFAGHPLVAESDIYSWEEGRTIILCDIDGTVAETATRALLFHRQDTESRPLPGAAQTLHDLVGEYSLVFMTARPVAWYQKTHEWLVESGFPDAPVVLAPSVRSALSAEQYKSSTIAMIRKLFPDALIGIGNAETDSLAYTANGLLALMIDDGKKRRFRSEAVPMRSWKQVQEFFTANRDVLSNPKRLRALLADGGLLLYPQPPLATPIEEEESR